MITPDLVNLVEHKERVITARAAQPREDLSRHRADVSASVTANLRLIADASYADAKEAAADRLRRPRLGGGSSTTSS